MNKSEALLYLDANNDDWQDVLELKLFDLKKDLFQRIVIPKILLKRAEKVGLWYQAESVLLGIETVDLSIGTFSFPSFEIVTKDELLKLYRSFESQLTTLQLELSQASNAKTVAEKLTELARLEQARQQAILKLAVKWLDNDTASTVKITDDVKTGVIISELNQLNKQELSKKDLLLLPNFKKDLERTLKSNR